MVKIRLRRLFKRGSYDLQSKQFQIRLARTELLQSRYINDAIALDGKLIKTGTNNKAIEIILRLKLLKYAKQLSSRNLYKQEDRDETLHL